MTKKYEFTEEELRAGKERIMAKKIDPDTLTHEELLIAYDALRSRLRSIYFRHRAALEFFKEMEIQDEFRAWVKLKAGQIGL